MFTRAIRWFILIFILNLFTGFPGMIPMTAGPLTYEAPIDRMRPTTPSLTNFIQSVASSQPTTLAGVYVENDFALPVIQQPAGDAGFVSNQPDVLTEFSLAHQGNSIGVLAHNHLAGAHFAFIPQGTIISLVYSDKTTRSYQVEQVRRYQALSPNSPYSIFVDADAPNLQISSAELFNQIYGQRGKLILQTCIAKDGQPSWGRLFVIARPMSKEVASTSVARATEWKSLWLGPVLVQ